MLYMYLHTHPVEKCIGNRPGAFMEQYGGPMRQAAEKAGIKIVSSYVDPLDHRFFIVFDVPDGKDILALREPLMAWMLWGSAQLIRVSPQPEMLT